MITDFASARLRLLRSVATFLNNKSMPALICRFIADHVESRSYDSFCDHPVVGDLSPSELYDKFIEFPDVDHWIEEEDGCEFAQFIYDEFN